MQYRYNEKFIIFNLYQYYLRIYLHSIQIKKIAYGRISNIFIVLVFTTNTKLYSINIVCGFQCFIVNNQTILPHINNFSKERLSLTKHFKANLQLLICIMFNYLKLKCIVILLTIAMMSDVGKNK